MIPQVLIPLANGFEEIEAICPIDLLRRAEVEVVTASCESELRVCGRSGIVIVADQFLSDAKPSRFDLLVLPGGPAVFELRKSESFLSFVRSFSSLNKPVAAICAAPLLLHDAGILGTAKFTAHGSVANELPGLIPNQAVVQDGLIHTSRGAGTAVEFGLHLVKILKGKDSADEIRNAIHA